MNQKIIVGKEWPLRRITFWNELEMLHYAKSTFLPYNLLEYIYLSTQFFEDSFLLWMVRRIKFTFQNCLILEVPFDLQHAFERDFFFFSVNHILDNFFSEDILLPIWNIILRRMSKKNDQRYKINFPQTICRVNRDIDVRQKVMNDTC